MGGAHAVAALAYGTESVPRADVIVGPGGLYVQEAKRLVSGVVGIDGFAGPSDVLVLAVLRRRPRARGPRPRRAGRARRGHDRLRGQRRRRASSTRSPSSPAPRPRALLDAPDLETALAFAEAFAPEHLELVGAAAERLAPRVRSAGCVFVGAEQRDGVRRLRRGLQPHAAHRRRGALRLGAERRATSAGASARCGSGPPPGRSRGRARRSRRPRASTCTRRRCGYGRIARREPHSADQPRDQGDQRRAGARPRRIRSGGARHRRRLPRPHARPRRPPRAPGPHGPRDG